MPAVTCFTARATIAGALALIAASSFPLGSADAESYRRSARPAYPMPSYVVAESRYGHGTVRGAIRMGRVGPQVQTPGGNWLDCGRNCAETLRRQTIDFWENGGNQMRDDGPGYLSFRWWF